MKVEVEILLQTNMNRMNRSWDITKWAETPYFHCGPSGHFITLVNLINNINKEAKTIAPELKLNDRIEESKQDETFVTLKDCKVNFKNEPKRRLINSPKPEVEIISKHYLELINNKIRENTQVNQWRNPKRATEWLKAIKNKSKSSFIKFDIVEFYPSISHERLSKTSKYAQSVKTIDEKVVKTI